MTYATEASADPALRAHILSDPSVVLDDPHVLEAILQHEDASRGGNIVDMRGAAMSRLQTRLDALESSKQTVISAAYHNVATTEQVHRAILAMIAPLDFDGFLQNLDREVADVLRIRAVRLVMEAGTDSPDSDLNPLSGTLSLLAPETVARFVSERSSSATYPVILRPVATGSAHVYGTAAHNIRSEAIVQLDLGPHRAPGLLVLGADEPSHFEPGQATDLLELFARVTERMLRGWLG